MVLVSGLYFICSLAAGNYCLGVEQTGPATATVITVPENTQPAVWYIGSINPSGTEYNVTVGGEPAGNRNGVLVASSQSDSVYWTITSRENPGGGAGYTVTLPYNGQGWLIKDVKPSAPVSVANLIVGPSEPPYFPSNELWSFSPTGEDFD